MFSSFRSILLAAFTAALFSPCINAAPQVNELSADYGGHRYILVLQRKNWQMAKRDAEARGGHLVEIASANEQKFVEQLIDKGMRQAAFPVWIGLSDEESEGTWKWVSDAAVVYQNWQRGQPTNDNGITPENYCVIWHSNAQSPRPNGYSGARKGQWNDVAGDNNLPYLVELDMAQNPSPAQDAQLEERTAPMPKISR